MKNNLKKILSLLLAVLMMAGLSTAAFATAGDFTGDKLSKDDLAAYYKVTQDDLYTDISAVKLNWSVPVVKYVENTVTTWDTEKLMWVKSEESNTTGDTVTFTLANYGSYAVKANVSFTPDVADSASVKFGTEVEDETSTTDPKEKKTINDNNPVIASIVNTDHSLKVTKTEGQTDKQYADAKTAYIDNSCTATIDGTVDMDLTKLSADSGKLGTYTVTISNSSAKLITFTPVTALKNKQDFGVSILSSDIVLSGNTWADVIAANKENTITFTYKGYTFEGTLSIYSENLPLVTIKAPLFNNPSTIETYFILTTTNFTGDSDYQFTESILQYCVNSTDAASATVYFVYVGN